MEGFKKERKVQDFYRRIFKSNDLNDNLQDLAEFLKEFTMATSVYIGKLVGPKRQINDDDDEKAHIDEEA